MTITPEQVEKFKSVAKLRNPDEIDHLTFLIFRNRDGLLNDLIANSLSINYLLNANTYIEVLGKEYKTNIGQRYCTSLRVNEFTQDLSFGIIVNDIVDSRRISTVLKMAYINLIVPMNKAFSINKNITFINNKDGDENSVIRGFDDKLYTDISFAFFRDLI